MFIPAVTMPKAPASTTRRVVQRLHPTRLVRSASNSLLRSALRPLRRPTAAAASPHPPRTTPAPTPPGAAGEPHPRPPGRGGLREQAPREGRADVQGDPADHEE